ncbi:hypothetical protein HDV62DRAFT_7392 [Trichoderma sp. SZMC 28011]
MAMPRAIPCLIISFPFFFSCVYAYWGVLFSHSRRKRRKEKKAIPFLVCSAQSSFAPGVVLANRAQHGYPCPGGFLWRAGRAGLGLAVLFLFSPFWRGWSVWEIDGLAS